MFTAPVNSVDRKQQEALGEMILRAAMLIRMLTVVLSLMVPLTPTIRPALALEADAFADTPTLAEQQIESLNAQIALNYSRRPHVHGQLYWRSIDLGYG